MASTAAYKLVELPGGVRGVYSIAEDEVFHPGIGPALEAEALHVRQLRLPERALAGAGEFVIWDVGLGAAANVLAVLRATRHARCPLRVVSFDRSLDPLRFALENAPALGYFAGYENSVATFLAHGVIRFQEHGRDVTWELRLADFPALLERSLASPPATRLPAPHAIFFDPFSPAKNPGMWTLPLFTDLFRHLEASRPCALTTYSRSTMLRVSLLLAGFLVGIGHSTGEKEETTVAANIPGLVAEPLGQRWLQRARKSGGAEPLHHPVYRQAPLAEATWEKLRRHPQFC